MEKALLVTTEHRGVFFGYGDGEIVDGKITLKRIRNCVYWSADVRGFLGLASSGPTASCRIGPAAEGATLTDVTCVAEVSPEAAARWEDAPWS